MSNRAGWWGRAVAVELALRADRLGTAPLLARSECSPASLARDNGLTSTDTIRLSEGIRLAVSAGLLSVVDSGAAIKVNLVIFDAQPTDSTGHLLAKLLSGENIDDFSPENLEQLLSLISQNPRSPFIKLIKLNSKRSNRGRPGVPNRDELTLFTRWRDGLGKSKRAKLDQKRLRSIRRALRPASKGGLGFTIAEIEQCLDGWVQICIADEWRMEKANRHELTLFLRDSQHIEEGLEATHRGATPQEGELMSAIQEAQSRRDC